MPASRISARRNSWHPTLENHVFSLFSSLGALARRPVASTMTILVMAIALALPAGFYVLLENLSRLSDGFPQSGEVIVFMDTAANDAGVATAATQIEEMSGVATLRALSPQAALEDFRAHTEFGDAVAALDVNPFPHVLVVELDPDLGAADAEALAVAIEDRPDVAFAQFDMAWLIRFNALLGVADRFVQILAGLLMLALVMIIGNTIRLDIENRREEIEITKMLGATHAFVRRPFLYAGAWLGLFAGLTAGMLVTLAVALLRGPVAAFMEAYASTFRLSGLDLTRLGLLCLIATAIGWIGSALAVARHVRSIEPR